MAVWLSVDPWLFTICTIHGDPARSIAIAPTAEGSTEAHDGAATGVAVLDGDGGEVVAAGRGVDVVAPHAAQATAATATATNAGLIACREREPTNHPNGGGPRRLRLGAPLPSSRTRDRDTANLSAAAATQATAGQARTR
jgi:hypothetical protein